MRGDKSMVGKYIRGSLLIGALMLAGAMAVPVNALAETPAKQLFGAKRSGSAQQSAPFGSYAKGCLAGDTQS